MPIPKDGDSMSSLGMELPLNEWLTYIYNPVATSEVIKFCFPSDKQRTEYLASVTERSDVEVRKLLESFLIHSGSLGSDQNAFDWLIHTKTHEPERYAALMKLTYYQRLMMWITRGGKQQSPPWEGITCILDLLPNHPHKALQALHSYFLAHCQLLPDGRIAGMQDAEAVIRAKYIGLPGTFADAIRFLLDQGWRAFECVVERLYNAMGYNTELTKPRNDGGRDVIARRDLAGAREHVVVECKLQNSPVEVTTIRDLHGVVIDNRANKGVLVTTNRFTRGSHRWANRNAIELIDGETLIPLMNRYLGSQWPFWLDRLVREAQEPGVHRGRS